MEETNCAFLPQDTVLRLVLYLSNQLGNTYERCNYDLGDGFFWLLYMLTHKWSFCVHMPPLFLFIFFYFFIFLFYFINIYLFIYFIFFGHIAQTAYAPFIFIYFF